MRRSQAIAGSLLFFVVAPCVMGGVIPWLIGHWQFHLMPQAARIAGIVLVVAGLPGLIDSFVRFAVEGLGTPAPVAPTKTLVVSGLYRHVRNPMYVAVTAVIFGQALLFGDRWIAAYGVVFWLTCHLFVIGYEEPALQQQFGEDYEQYRRVVPRWFPRLVPWKP